MWSRHALLAALSGRWSLNRSVESIASGDAMAAMRGTASFALRSDDRAHYSESVTLLLEGGPAMPARQQYFYHQEGDTLEVFFDEAQERLFHRLVPKEEGNGLVARDVHLCAPDRYESRYEFRRDGSFVITHVVDGPRKSYVSRTVFVRER